VRRRAALVRLLVLDVDGVLTDGHLYYGPDGIELKAFHIHDGLGLRMLMASGIQVAIITGRSSRAVELRAENLGISNLYQGVADKLEAFRQLLGRVDLDETAVAAVGDDLPDVPILRRSALAVCVPQAPETVRRHCHYVTERSGGSGAVREVCELLMHAQETLATQLERYLG
jgi:3-deoxy-D-manno-octulosonate 8-phosphate phosphatase (KDO 8-P phosphatase)